MKPLPSICVKDIKDGRVGIFRKKKVREGINGEKEWMDYFGRRRRVAGFLDDGKL